MRPLGCRGSGLEFTRIGGSSVTSQFVRQIPKHYVSDVEPRSAVFIAYFTRVSGTTSQFNVLHPLGPLAYNYHQPLAQSHHRYRTRPHNKARMELLRVWRTSRADESSLFSRRQRYIRATLGIPTAARKVDGHTQRLTRHDFFSSSVSNQNPFKLLFLTV